MSAVVWTTVVAWGLVGSAAATGGGYFGGHLVQRLGLAVDHTTFHRWVIKLVFSQSYN